MDNVITGHQAIMDLPKSHRVMGRQLLTGGFTDSFDLCVGASLTLYLTCHLNLPTVEGLTQSLYPVEQELALLVAHQRVPVALFGFAQDGALELVAPSATEYPVSGHEDVPSWSGPRGATNTAGAVSLSNPFIVSYLT